VSRLTLSCGLLAVPIITHTGTDAQTPMPRSSWLPVDQIVEGEDGADDVQTEWHEVGSQPYDKATGGVIEEKESIVMRAQATDGTWVPLSKQEMDEVLGDTEEGVAEVVAFVPRAALLRDYVVVKWDQVRAADRSVGRKRTPDPGAERAFEIVTRAMANKDVFALVKVARQWVAMTPDGYWLRLAYAHTVRAPKEFPHPEVQEREVQMAEKLIDVLTEDEPVMPVDEAGPQLQAYVDEKAKLEEGERPTVTAVAAPVPVADVVGALEASLMVLADAKKAKAGKATAKRTRKAS
jgi:non-homologous end joining protein Ku